MNKIQKYSCKNCYIHTGSPFCTPQALLYRSYNVLTKIVETIKLFISAKTSPLYLIHAAVAPRSPSAVVPVQHQHQPVLASAQSLHRKTGTKWQRKQNQTRDEWL